jgi:ATP-dependent RNA helicase DDX27
MAMDEDKEEGVDKAVSAAIRSAKKAARPSKIGHSSTKLSSPSKARSGKQARSGGKKGKGAFDSDFGSRGSSNNHEGVRAVKGTKPNLNKKLGGGKKTGKK